MYFYEQVLYEREPPNIKQFDLNRYERNLPQQVRQEKPVQNVQQKVPMQQQMLQPNQQQQPEENPNGLEQEQQYIDAQEQSDALISTSIKKYFLIRRLFALNDKLNRLRVKNDILNIVINFVDNFSYDSLLIITKKLLEEIAIQIKSNEEIKDT
jgi:hypothetical protein